MKEPITPKSQIVSQLRRLWMSSRERSAAMKSTGYCCDACGVKQSKKKGAVVKLEVHHLDGVLNWDKIVELIREQLLCDVTKLQPLCKECHDKETYGRN